MRKIIIPVVFLAALLFVLFSFSFISVEQSKSASEFLYQLTSEISGVPIDSPDNLTLSIFGLIGSLVVMFSIIASMIVIFLQIVRPSSEKAEQDIASRFSVEEKELRRQIEKERDEEKKQALKQQALELRQKYETLMDDNLRRKDGTFVTDWREVLLASRKRLLNEEQRLLARNRMNMSIGISMSFAAVFFLIIYMIFRGQVGEINGFWEFVAINSPAFSVVFIIESFSLWFLRRYIVGERELDRNKNEITNIELRITAGLMMASASDNPDLTSLAGTLSKEQRNFVLDKDESSAVLDPHKFIETLLKLASKGGG